MSHRAAAPGRACSARGALAACLLLSCAEPAPAPVVPADASVSDAGPEAAADGADGSPADVVAESDSAWDAAQEPVDLCSSDAWPEGSNEPCTPGELDRMWCGRCGQSVRKCGPDGAWKPWSECLEDDAAECAPCESLPVACGYCGTRTVRCEHSQQVCRWVLQACDSPGECAPGDYQLDGSGCAEGTTRVRWCSSACSWAEPAGCQAPPAWVPLASAPLAARAEFASAAVAGLWFIWGGVGQSGALSDGALLEPSAGTWSMLPPAQWSTADGGVAALSPRARATVVSVGDAVFVWGGDDGAMPAVTLGDGARYHVQGGWSAVSGIGAPSARTAAAAVHDAAAGRVLLWGGRAPTGGAAKAGARYDLASDSWTSMSPAPMQSRQGHSAVWDAARGRMLVWGGMTDGATLPEAGGAAYEPATDTWTSLADAPIRRTGHVAFWDSAHSRMIVLLGNDGLWGGQRSDGAAWDGEKNTWSLLPDLALTGFPAARGLQAVIGGGQIWVLGGEGASDGYNTGRGARFEPVTQAWARLPELGQARTGHRAMWLNGLLTWGGQGPFGSWLASGERLANVP